MKLARWSHALTAAAGAALLAACADTPMPTEAFNAPSLLVSSDDPVRTELWVCVDGPAGTYSFGATFTEIVSASQDPTITSPFDLTAGTCGLLATDPDARSDVDISETARPGNTQFLSGSKTIISGAINVTPVITGPTAVGAPPVLDIPVGLEHGAIVHLIYEAVPDEQEGCTYTQGWYKNAQLDKKTGLLKHPWPVNSLTLGTVVYTEAQLRLILDAPVNGNGLISLAHQLIAAKLNIAGGADDTDIAADIAAADALIGALVIPPVGAGYLAPATTSSLVDALTDFNEGTTGPGHCDDEEIGT